MKRKLKVPFKKWKYPLDIFHQLCTVRSFLEELRLIEVQLQTTQKINFCSDIQTEIIVLKQQFKNLARASFSSTPSTCQCQCQNNRENENDENTGWRMINLFTWETTATNRCWTPRAIATWEQSSSKEGEHLPPFKTSGSSYHCWWKIYSRDRGKQEIIDKDLDRDKDKDKDRRSQTKTLTVTVWSDSPTHLQKQVSRGTWLDVDT